MGYISFEWSRLCTESLVQILADAGELEFRGLFGGYTKRRSGEGDRETSFVAVL
jgi:hypothetical protein